MKKLGFGLMRLPLTDPDDYASVDVEAVKKMADTFMERGFTYFDTAAPYHRGQSEVAFREAVAKRYPRTSYTITDKLSLFMLKSEAEFRPFLTHSSNAWGWSMWIITCFTDLAPLPTGRRNSSMRLNLSRS